MASIFFEWLFFFYFEHSLSLYVISRQFFWSSFLANVKLSKDIKMTSKINLVIYLIMKSGYYISLLINFWWTIIFILLYVEFLRTFLNSIVLPWTQIMSSQEKGALLKISRGNIAIWQILILEFPLFSASPCTNLEITIFLRAFF